MAGLRSTGVGLSLVAALAPLGAAVPLSVALTTAWLEFVRSDAPQRRALLIGLGASHALLLVAQLWGARRASRLRRGTPGRARALSLSVSAALLAVASGALVGLLGAIAQALGSTPVFGLADLLELSDPWLSQLTSIALGTAGLAGVATLVSLLGAWFLISERTRRRLWWAADALLLASVVLTTYRYALVPAEDAPRQLLGPSLRLSATLLFGLRASVRALPHLLDGIERLDVRSLVASRHLRAKKSGFLAAISALSILAVTVSCWALTTTLSVMGGFRQDLKRKILGNNAHIVVGPERGTFDDGDAVVNAVRGVEGVQGVSPYVSGEVMVSSASNLAGAVLRGIDPAQLGEVTDLPRNMRVGSLDYLANPDELLDLPSDVLHLSVPPPRVKHLTDEEDAPPATGAKGLMQDLDRLLEEAGEGDGVPPDVRPSAPTVDPAPLPRRRSRAATADLLPGVVVGQELARSLRLYLGDEVNIVSPLGTLGPTGPMPKSRAFRVAGIFYTGMYEYDMKFVYALLPTAQSFLSTDTQLSGVEVKVAHPDDAPEIAQAVERAVGRPALHARPWQELNKNLFGALALERLAMFVALGIAILVASFCIIGTLTLMVQEKGREVAILKAMGARDRAIIGVFVLEGTLIGLFGAALGLALGYAMCFAAEHFGIRLNPEVYYIDRLPVHIDPLEFAGVGVSAILVCLLVTVYPALLASRLRPVEALRYE